MARHKEKDDEAGGEGLGVLATRKRLWRDAEGNIVNARRPSYTQPEGAKRRQLSRSTKERKGAGPQQQPQQPQSEDQVRLRKPMTLSLPTPPTQMSRAASPTSSTIIADTHPHSHPHTQSHLPNFLLHHSEDKDSEVNRDSWLDMTPSLPSPPLSSPSSSSQQSPSAEIDDLDTLYEDSWPTLQTTIHHSHSHSHSSSSHSSPGLGRTSQYPDTPTWGPQPFQTFMGAVGELPYEDLFRSGSEPSSALYEWPGMGWGGGSGSGTMSRCREEKFEPFAAEKRDLYPEALLRRGFGLGTC